MAFFNIIVNLNILKILHGEKYYSENYHVGL